MGRAVWGDADIENLKRWWLDGLSASLISKAFKNRFSRNAVVGKAHRLGLEGRAPSWRKKPEPPPKSGRLAETEAKEIAKLENEPVPIGPVGDFPDLRDACLWPHGAGATFQCCGHPAQDGKIYCQHHSARAFVAPRTQQKEEKKHAMRRQYF